ncbi:hypothetical protein ACWHA3_25810 [Streptomyces cyaneofuscatus]
MVAALGASALPALAAPGEDPAPAPAPVSVWGPGGPKAEIPPVKVGSNKPVANAAEAAPSDEKAAWLEEEKDRAETGASPAPARHRPQRGGRRAVGVFAGGTARRHD